MTLTMYKYSSFIIALLLIAPFVVAQEEEGDGGVTPDSILWGLDRAFESVSLALTFNEHSQALKHLEIARERRLEAQAMVERGRPDHAERAMGKWEEQIDAAEESQQELEDDGETEEAEEIEEGIANAIAQLQNNRDRFLNDDNPNNDNALKGIENALRRHGVEVDTMDDDPPGNETDDDLPGNETSNETEVDVTFVMTGENFAFMMESETNPTITVNEGDLVRIEFSSTDGFHDWVVDEFDAATTQVNPEDGTVTVEFVANTAGEYMYYCSVGSHRANGMEGTLIVA